MFNDFYVPKKFEVCVLDNNSLLEHSVVFESIYPYMDAGWYEDLEVYLYDILGPDLDYQVLSFALVVI